MPSRIESPVNPKVKHLVRLRKSSRYRKETGLFFLEGKREIEAMLVGGRKLDEIFFPANIESKDELSSLRELSKGIPDFELTDAEPPSPLLIPEGLLSSSSISCFLFPPKFLNNLQKNLVP